MLTIASQRFEGSIFKNRVPPTHMRGWTWNLVCRCSFAFSFIWTGQTDVLGTFTNPQFYLGPLPLSCQLLTVTSRRKLVIDIGKLNSHGFCYLTRFLGQTFNCNCMTVSWGTQPTFFGTHNSAVINKDHVFNRLRARRCMKCMLYKHLF